MTNDVTEILKKLDIEEKGRFENGFYIIDLKNSDDYAKKYTKLEKNAVNAEYPSFGTNTNDTTVKITNYFETEVDNVNYNVFLIADFDNDKYYLKISEK